MRRLPWILPRAVTGELLPPFVLATLITTFILVARFLFTFAELLVSRDASTVAVLSLLLYSLPHVLVLTLPMALLFASVITVSRWSGDSEVIALEACGVRGTVLGRALASFGIAVFVVDVVLALWILPESNRRFQESTRKMYFAAARAAIEPRVFTSAFPGQLIYVDRTDPETNEWRGVLVIDLTDAAQETLINAEKGAMVESTGTDELWLRLSQATVHSFRPARPERYQRSFNAEMQVLLQAPNSGSITVQYGPRETASWELWQRSRDFTEPASIRREAWVELQKRLALPAANLAFAFLGFPLGLRSRRGGKGYGLTVSVLTVVAYYVLLNHGELAARSGKLPVWLGVWLPNIAVLLFAGLALRYRTTRPALHHSGPSWLLILWQRIVLFFRVLRPSPRPVPQAASESSNGQRCSPPVFLACIDRWVLTSTLRFFLLVLLAVCGLYVAVNLSEQLEEIQRNNVPLVVVGSYYLYLLPQILHDTVPLAFLIAFLGTAAVLEKHNETVALKAAGISLTRLALPLLSAGLVLGVGLFLMDETLVQRANQTSQKLEDVIKGRKGSRGYRFTDQSFLFLPDGRTVVNFLLFDADTETLLRPSLYIFDDHLTLKSRWMAQKATFKNGRWLAEHAWRRTFLPDGTEDFEPSASSAVLPINVGPEYFKREFRKPSQMSLGELRRYIQRLRTAGYRVDKLLVQFHQKLAYPLSLLLLPWLALPYAFRIGRKGTVVGIATALVLAMVYFSLTALASKLGEVALLPPTLAAWVPSVTFFLLALNRQTTLRT